MGGSSATDYWNVVNPVARKYWRLCPLVPPRMWTLPSKSSESAYETWKRIPAGKRIQYLFKLKRLLEENIDELSRTITLESGKTFVEAKARR